MQLFGSRNVIAVTPKKLSAHFLTLIDQSLITAPLKILPMSSKPWREFSDTKFVYLFCNTSLYYGPLQGAHVARNVLNLGSFLITYLTFDQHTSWKDVYTSLASRTHWEVGYGVTVNIAASHTTHPLRVPRQLGVRFPVPKWRSLRTSFFNRHNYQQSAQCYFEKQLQYKSVTVPKLDRVTQKEWLRLGV